MTTRPAKDDTEAKLLGKALARLRERAGMTQPQAAHAFGIESSAGWSKYENGKASTIFHPDIQKRLVAAVGATVEDLIAERTTLATPTTARPAAIAPLESPRRDPTPFPGMCAVYGYAAGAGEKIAVATGSELRWVPIHPNQRGYAKVGAAEVVGESMYPRFKPRELAYFVFDVMPPRGDDVIIELLDGTALIKEYVGRTPENLIVREFFPADRTFEVSLKTVKALHAVVGR